MSEAHQILPSRHGRSASGEQDHEGAIWDHDEQLKAYTEVLEQVDAPATPTRRITPTMLAMTTQCELRALWKFEGKKGLDSTPFASAAMTDGSSYEAALLADGGKSIWLNALERALGIHLPPDIRAIDCPCDARQAQETSEAFAIRVKDALQAALHERPTEPFYLSKTRLAMMENGALLHGRPDLLIWTGEQWIIAEIKCAEEARRTHGMQVATYARIFKYMLPGESLYPQGAIIHCAPGYGYTALSSDVLKRETLSHTIATCFPLESMEAPLGAAISLLAHASDQSVPSAIDHAVFSSVCVECEFRVHCYPRFLKDGHISLVPMLRGELDALLAAGVRTIDGLIETLENEQSETRQMLLEFKENCAIQLRFLQEISMRVKDAGFFSAWRVPDESLKAPLFFVATGQETLFQPPLREFSEGTLPSCLVVHSEDERRRAWEEISKQIPKIAPSYDFPAYVLGGEIQQRLHGPVPSLTLRPLAEALTAFKGKNGVISYYVPELEGTTSRLTKESLADSLNAQERMEQLLTVWNFLSETSTQLKL